MTLNFRPPIHPVTQPGQTGKHKNNEQSEVAIRERPG